MDERIKPARPFQQQPARRWDAIERGDQTQDDAKEVRELGRGGRLLIEPIIRLAHVEALAPFHGEALRTNVVRPHP